VTSKIGIAIAGLLFLAACATTPSAPPAARAELAPAGKLRVGINLGNGVIATRDPATGQARGIAVNIARELGRRLDVPVEYVVFARARNAADAMQAGAVDVVFIAIEPVRAAVIDFTAPYAEIAGTYAVSAGLEDTRDRRSRPHGRAHFGRCAQQLRFVSDPHVEKRATHSRGHDAGLGG